MSVTLKGRPREVATFQGLLSGWSQQSFSRDPVTGRWYCSVPAKQDATDTDLLVYRLTPDGEVLDHMTLTTGGHGQSFCVQYDAGQAWIWLWWNAVGARRVPYQPGAEVASTHSSVETLTQRETRPSYYYVDSVSGTVATMISQVGGNQEFTLRRITDYVGGTTDEILGTVGPLTTVSHGVAQGHASHDGTLVATRGGTTSALDLPATLIAFDWSTGAETSRLDVSGVDVTGHIEAEGVQIESSGRVLFGISSGNVGTRSMGVFELTGEATSGGGSYKTLLLDVQSVAGGVAKDAVVSVGYDRTVARPGVGVIPAGWQTYVKVADQNTVEVVACDDPDLDAASMGFDVLVRASWTDPRGTLRSKSWRATITTDMADEVALSTVGRIDGGR